MNRRDFIKGAALTATMAGGGRACLAPGAEAASPADGTMAPAGPHDLIDTHVYLSRWPFRRLAGDETPKLASKLKEYGVTSAWAGSFDALLHRDMAAVNIRLAEECAAEREVRLLPFGAINPTLPDWEEELRRCHEVHGMPGVRLHPDFHGYTLDDPRFGRLMELATRRRLAVQIGLGMVDPRLQHPLALLPPVNPSPLLDLLPKYPAARVVLLNFWRSFGNIRLLLAHLSDLPQVGFDLATVEGVGGIEALLKTTPSLRLVFGSYAPYYNAGSSWWKLRESILTPEQIAAIGRARAAEILARA